MNLRFFLLISGLILYSNLQSVELELNFPDVSEIKYNAGMRCKSGYRIFQKTIHDCWYLQAYTQGKTDQSLNVTGIKLGKGHLRSVQFTLLSKAYQFGMSQRLVDF